MGVPIGPHIEVGNDSVRALPTGAPLLLAPYVHDLVHFVMYEVVEAAPEFAFVGSTVEEIVTTGVRYALLLSESHPEVAVTSWQPGRTTPDVRTVGDLQRLFRALGRQELLAGRSMDRLHAAYYAAGRAAWQFLLRELSELAHLDPAQLHHGAEAIFATVETVSALSMDGYAVAKDEAAGDQGRARARLLRLLISDPPPTLEAVHRLAATAGWPVPSAVIAVAVDAGPADAEPPAAPLGPEALRDLANPRPCLLLPAASGLRPAVRIEGRRVALGPMVATIAAARSLAVARRALELQDAGVLPPDDVVDSTHHLDTMLLTSDPSLTDHLTMFSLAEFGRVPVRQRERLAATLLSWLHHRGNSIEVAEDLGVHPQTVRYRVAQLRELFGDRLDDAGERFRMCLALTACKLLGRTSDPATWSPDLPPESIGPDVG